MGRVKSCRNVWKIKKAPMSSITAVRPIIKRRIFFVCFQESRSSISPAITWLESPKFTKSETTKKVSVIRPSPPICISIIMIAWPMGVKLSRGTVKSPVTQVHDVAVKRRSIKAIGCVLEKGSDSKKVPRAMAINMEMKMVRLGEKK